MYADCELIKYMTMLASNNYFQLELLATMAFNESSLLYTCTRLVIRLVNPSILQSVIALV